MLQSDEEKLDLMLDIIGFTKFTRDEVKMAAMLFYKKLLAAFNYTPLGKFHGPITLFKASDGFQILQDEQYGLSKVRPIFYRI